VLDDGEVDGNDAASSFVAAATAAHLSVAADDQYLGNATNYSSMVQSVVQSHAECVLISAEPQNHAVALTDALAAAMPNARLFATAGLAVPAFVDPADGGVSPTVAPRLLLTLPTLDGTLYPPRGRRFLTAYARRYGSWEPDAIFGYEAMSLMLDAVSRATDGGRRPAVRSRVIHAIFATRDRHSVLGTYSIDRQGDTTLHQFGVYRIEDGRLVFVEALTG
jgi:branched-chain amino acid transport system substrate-binding protein